ncbi:MAG: rod shape-determining protein MreC [Desulfobacterales bacterium]|nr:MAG: rod shape-determining protein MreC [Desulfobacterales bacterium]
MFSRRMALILGLAALITVNLIVLSFATRSYSPLGMGRVAISFVAPFQKLITRSMRFAREVWEHYFFLVAVSQENQRLKKSLSQAVEKNNHLREIELSNLRLRSLLNFQQSTPKRVLAAEVIGKDPSTWFNTVIIDKGEAEGLRKGLAVVMSEGIVGQVIETSAHYSKVMLIIDRNSAVDALIQRTRARGVIKGGATDQCYLEYALRKHDIEIGDTVISSGLDGVYPKGLRIGRVSDIIRRNSAIFQAVTVAPFVDFETLEEVLVILDPPKHEFETEQ